MRGSIDSMKRGTWAAHTDELVRASRNSVIRVQKLQALGVPEGTSYRRCQPGGPWRWLLPGIVLLSNAQPTRRQQIEAALLHGGPEALLTGCEAVREHGLRQIPEIDRIHILVPQGRHIRSARFVAVERTIHMPEAVQRHALRLAPLDRAVLDAVRRWRRTDPVRALLAEAVQRGRCHPGQLLAELDSGSRRGSALPRQVLSEINQGARSVAEAIGLRIWQASGLPAAVWNAPVVDGDGRFIAVPDAWCDEVAMAWEIDSFEWHFNARGYARTVARNTRYAGAGIVVVQTLPSRLRDDPAGVTAELRAAYRAASTRPRPPVRSVPSNAA
ncbi:hypothetical protein [Kutzneria sp. CA-103260]|uniref:hypothetical protein n=1 Tax=Kutzneria sp. CA-103260 TaxID=2802641 RepID=UPI001BF13B16|nr:hypothetical protein [Kutzneria sp. CA-103260]QUQ69201.1 hypothetical protein JJ691_69560 [Kutzneria sp. CA-103260]